MTAPPHLLCIAGLYLLACLSYLVAPSQAATTCGTTASSLNTAVTTLLKTSSSNAAGVDLYQTTPDVALVQNYTFRFPVTLTIAATPTYISRTYPNGTTNPGATSAYIGLAINGVTIFNDANANGVDAYINEKQTFDACLGHNSPNPKGAYHFHSNPGTTASPGSCVYSDTTGKHSPVFAVMVDGIPLYGVYGDNGLVPTDLDTCRGHTDSTYPFYHYHMTVNWTAPCTVYCLRGCVYYNQGHTLLNSMVVTSSTCKAASTQYSYSALSLPTIWTGIASTASPSPASAPSPSPANTPSPTPSSSSPSPSPSSTATSPSSTPNPSSPSSSSTSSPSPSSPSPSPSTFFTYTIQYTFQMDYTSLAANATLMSSFKTSLQTSVATASGVSRDRVSVLSVVAGSVVAATQINYPSSSFSDSQAAALTSSASSPSTFSSAFLSTYGVSGVSAAVLSPDDSSSAKLSKGAIIGIAAGVGGGVALIAVAVLVVLLGRKKDVARVNPTSPAGEGKGV